MLALCLYHTYTHVHTHLHAQCSVKATLCGTSTHELEVCLARLNSHLTTTSGQYLVRDSLSLADVVTWASLYVLLAPNGSSVDDSKGIYFFLNAL